MSATRAILQSAFKGKLWSCDGCGEMRGWGGFPFLKHDMVQASFALSKLYICVQHSPLHCSGQGTELYKFPHILPQST